MKICGVVLMLMLFLSQSVFAIAPLNLQSIKQAQLYGSSQSKVELTQFLKPWLAYEEKAEQLNANTEMAYLYTPFLLIATNAREKRLHNEPIMLEDSEKVITDYLDTMSFSVRLYGNSKDFLKNAACELRQGELVLKVWDSAVPEAAEECTWLKNVKYTAQCYFYFNEKEIDTTKPVTLIIATQDKKERRFYFELNKIK